MSHYASTNREPYDKTSTIKRTKVTNNKTKLLQSKMFSARENSFANSQSLSKLGLLMTESIVSNPSECKENTFVSDHTIRKSNFEQQTFARAIRLQPKLTSSVKTIMDTPATEFHSYRKGIKPLNLSSEPGVFFKDLAGAKIIFKRTAILNMDKLRNTDSTYRGDECFIWFSHNLIFEEFL